MKRELWALLVLAALLAAALINVRHADRLMTELAELVQETEDAVTAGNFPAAEETLRRAMALWKKDSVYTHILIRHSEVDSTADVFYELLSELREKSAAAAAECEKLRAHLLGIAAMEHVTLGNIF